MKLALCLVALFITRALSTPTYCIPTQPLTPSFCFNPPTVEDFDLTKYTGKWYQLYTSGTATFVSTNRCPTANYTQLEDGIVGVLNCQLPESGEKPECLRGEATRRVGALPPQLEVSFSSFIPAGSYNVAGLLGDAESGYEAAAVYSCVDTDRGPAEGVYIIARSPRKPEYVLDGLFQHMRCLGYELKDAFVPSYHGDDCKYFDEEDGFEEQNIFGTAGAPPNVAAAAAAGVGGSGPPEGLETDGA